MDYVQGDTSESEFEIINKTGTGGRYKTGTKGLSVECKE